MTAPSSDTTIPITVLLFGPLREALGQAQLVLLVEAGATAAGVLEALTAEYEALSRFRDVLRVAVDGTYASPAAALHPGAELALITPTSGG